MKNVIRDTWNVYNFMSCDCYLCNFSHNNWSKFWLIQRKIYQTVWLLYYIDGDLSNFNLCLCLIDISASQECLTDLWTILFLCWIWTGAWRKVLNKEKCIFWKKTQNCFNSKIFQSFSFSMKDFPQIILLISNYILKIISQVF